MKKQLAAVTTAFALAGLGVATNAEAHGPHGHGGYHNNGRDAAAALAGAAIVGGIILQQQNPGYYPHQRYYAPPPRYYAPPPPAYYQPPVYVAPALPPVEVDCYDKEGADRYGYPIYGGSVRTYQDQNNGATFQRFSRQPCF